MTGLTLPRVDGTGRAFGRPQARAAIRSVAKVLGTLLVLSAITFVATNAVPSDPARVALGRFATAQQLDDFRVQQGLDKPVVARYFYWIGKFVRGDWGTSVANQQPVRTEVLPRFERTAVLALLSFALAVPIALAVGVHTGRRTGSSLDHGVSLATLLIVALPEFVIAVLMLAVFAVWLGALPVDSSALSLGGLGIVDTIKAYALPVLTLTLTLVPYITRLMRANVREVAAQPFVRSATLQGIRGWRLSARRIAPNAARPVVAVLALNLAELVGGVVVVETVFGFPGAGQLLVSSVQAQDIPTVQALVLLIGGLLIVFNLLADLALAWLNPRLRLAAR